MKDILSNKRILALIIFIFLILVLVIILVFQARGRREEPSRQAQEINVVHISPSKELILTPGSKQSFLISFSGGVDPKQIEVGVNSQDIETDEEVQKEEIVITYPASTLINIALKDPIKDLHRYFLKVINNKTDKVIYETEYMSDTPPKLRESDNNEELLNFLPYRTKSYSLNYVPERNIYVFSFKYDDTSKESVEVQYDRAKADAIKFIQSKGIDINSIKIEWNFH